MGFILSPVADVYPAGAPAELLIYAPDKACAQVEVQTGWKNKTRLERKSVWLDENGLGRTAFSFAQTGVHPVRAVGGRSGELGACQVLVGKKHDSPVSAALDRCERDQGDKQLRVGATVFYNRHPHQGKVLLDLLSVHEVVSSREVESRDGVVEAVFPLPEEVPLFLVVNTLVTRRKIFLALPEGPVGRPSGIRLSVPEQIEKGAPLPVSIVGGNGRTGLLVISDARCAASGLRDVACGASASAVQVFPKPIDVRLKTGKLPGFVHRSAILTPVCQAVSLQSFSKEFQLPDGFDTRRWQVRLFVPAGDGFGALESVSEVYHPPGLSLNLPAYVAPGDEIEGTVGFNPGEEEAELAIQNGAVSRRSLQSGEVGEERVMVKGEPGAHLDVTLAFGSGEVVQEAWQNGERDEIKTPVLYTYFAGPGETFDREVAYTIYPRPGF